MAQSATIPTVSHRAKRIVPVCLLAVASLFWALHALHLTADFPNHSPWMDWAKYTDEGWYGDAAIRHYQRGQWYVRGDFNPAAALPVWPMLESVVFQFTGVGIAAARGLTVAIFGGILAAAFVLLRRPSAKAGVLAPAAAVLLLAVSPFCYVFTRMAILEPLLVLWMLLALLAASAAPARIAATRDGRLRRWWPALALGLLLPVMVLTKTTAIFLFPAIAWMLWAAAHYRPRLFFKVGGATSAIALASWLAYFGLVVRPRFLADYRYLFSANGYTGITPATALSVLGNTVMDGLWMGRVLFPLSLTAGCLLLAMRRRKVSPLAVALLLWAAGYAAFLAYHNNLQPRYYLVVAVPLTLLLPLAFEEIASGLKQHALRAALGVAAALALLAIAVPDALQTLRYVRAPEYTFLEAARRVQAIVAADRTQSPLVLSISGSDLSLMTGLPSICDDFGTMELADRVAVYRPGWYAAWNQVDDDKMEALAPLFRLRRVAAFPAMDDPERNLLILYRLDPHGTEAARPKHPRPPVPRLLQTRIGQQPSTTQLVH